ncbi:MAG: Molybdopterin binding domain-containing protein [Candidatus Tokpelaia hoelldobleri]|uniref:Molybdopterin binding domain-containing protein n=1 Tax=Candidatus Tokpelaia hoelldobleri TaxID=1902579 RepID=A0A1U9JTX7_9HYPH|nr:MAG: Molybdopterin binding domain-containing protein [Candidatus Tokpelaia hoelldoblerii]
MTAENTPASAQSITAAMVAIGDELLSGRTRDSNIGYLAAELTKHAIDLKEVRIVPDESAAIIAAVNALRARYDYVFTSGGIGPTHDDITAPSIAEALGLPCIYDEAAEKLLSAYYQERQLPLTPARRQMARMPQGAEHIANPVSIAPGFHIANVFVMAGIPQIFQTMVQNVLPQLEKGKQMLSLAIPCPLGEGTFGEALAAIQTRHPQTSIGSYPHFNPDNKNPFPVEIVIRAREESHLQQAAKAVEDMISTLLQTQT